MVLMMVPSSPPPLSVSSLVVPVSLRHQITDNYSSAMPPMAIPSPQPLPLVLPTSPSPTPLLPLPQVPFRTPILEPRRFSTTPPSSLMERMLASAPPLLTQNSLCGAVARALLSLPTSSTAHQHTSSPFLSMAT